MKPAGHQPWHDSPWFNWWLTNAQVAIVCLLLGCSPNPPALHLPETPVIISAAQLEQVFERNEIWGYPLTADRYYAVPTLQWFVNIFPGEWSRFAESELIGPYIIDSNDCDDWARGAAFFAQMLHSRSKHPNGLSVGEFWYESRNGPHAIVAAVCADGTNLVIAFMEPQGVPRIIHLDRSEYGSCMMRRF